LNEKEIKDCLKRERPGLLRRRSSIKKAESHLRKAFWNLKAMNHNYNGKFYDWAIITGYYAMYFASLGALWTIGLWGKDHVCVIKALKFFFVEKGRLERKYLRAFDKTQKLEKKYTEKLERARKQRIRVQYNIAIVEDKDAMLILKNAKDFVRRMEKLVNEIKQKG
jgi:uncharacterized protein (UPF0332 family)